MKHLSEIPRFSYLVTGRYIYFCPSCADAVRRGEAHCAFCGSMPRADGWPLCENCYSDRLIREYKTVERQISRAMKMGVAATLTLDEWVSILEEHKWTCIYCRTRPYEALDHFVPISRGGGTTADNCVPACNKCNQAKSDRDPELIKTISSLSPQEIIRVEKILAQRKNQSIGG
jgi:HNH endonuclease